MKVFTTEQLVDWNAIVKSFANWDIYYLCEYSISLQHHGDGIPYFIYYENGNFKMCYIMMKNDIATIDKFRNHIPDGIYYDFTTPYGYGGPLMDGECSDEILKLFFIELTDFCNKECIVTQFFRFHPLLQNQKLLFNYADVISIKETIYINLDSEEVILKNMDTKNRNMICKAQSNGITIHHDTGEHLKEFINIYNSTMKRKEALSYYTFSADYFNYLFHNLSENTVLFYAQHEGRIISAAIFFYNDKFMHYHLSGTLTEFRSLASNNLLLYEAALWGCRKGIKMLHLGGGVGIGSEDSLFNFKKKFNKNGHLDFAIGRTIFDAAKYQALVDIRRKNDDNFDVDNGNLIQYRV